MYSSVSVFGLGYIGLPTAAFLADFGFTVCGVDVKSSVINTINSGLVHFDEPHLASLVQSVVRSGLLSASLDPTSTDVYIIAVPTPFSKTEGNLPLPDTKYVFSAAKSISSVIKPGSLVLLESTCPVGTTTSIAQFISENANLNLTDFSVAYCPERVLPGNILHELRFNDRVVGGINPSSSSAAQSFYKQFCAGEVFTTNSHTAELVKLAENSYRDTNLAFANELSIISSKLGVDVYDLINLANRHPRVNILNPGCGVGGHCIAVDPWFIVSSLPDDSPLIRTSREVNDNKPRWVLSEIESYFKTFDQKYSRPPVLACLGLSFKPNVDDIRESPALYIARSLFESYPNTLFCDPHVDSPIGLPLSTIDDCLSRADTFIFLVAHDEFKSLHLNSISYLDFCGLSRI